jgi:hypothetical protein
MMMKTVSGAKSRYASYDNQNAMQFSGDPKNYSNCEGMQFMISQDREIEENTEQ